MAITAEVGSSNLQQAGNFANSAGKEVDGMLSLGTNLATSVVVAVCPVQISRSAVVEGVQELVYKRVIYLVLAMQVVRADHNLP